MTKNPEKVRAGELPKMIRPLLLCLFVHNHQYTLLHSSPNARNEIVFEGFRKRSKGEDYGHGPDTKEYCNCNPFSVGSVKRAAKKVEH